MRYIKLDPMDYPLNKGESWWIIHPNLSGCEFIVPAHSTTACISDLLNFKKGIVYRVIGYDKDSGWVTVANKEEYVEVPQYLFARHFDAEIFIRGANISPVNIPSVWTDGYHSGNSESEWSVTTVVTPPEEQ